MCRCSIALSAFQSCLSTRKAHLDVQQPVVAVQHHVPLLVIHPRRNLLANSAATDDQGLLNCAKCSYDTLTCRSQSIAWQARQAMATSQHAIACMRVRTW